VKKERFSSKGKIPNYILLCIAMVILLLLVGMSDLNVQESFVVAYFIYTFLRFINNLSNTINIFDFLIFFSTLSTLLSAVIAYRFFGASNFYTHLWRSGMGVPEETYFDYLIPANLALFAGLNLVFYKNTRNAVVYVERAKAYVADKTKVGVTFIAIGLVSTQFMGHVPESLSFIFYLFGMLGYVGGFYLYFSLKKRRGLVITLMTVAFFLQALQKGVFGEFIMYVMLAASLIIAQYRFRFLPKLSLFVIGFFAIVILQSVKIQYRNLTWTSKGQTSADYRGKGNAEIFSDLVMDRLTDPSSIFSEKSLFYMNRRLNQGWLISLTMNYVPRVEPFANGETIWLSLAAVLVPRFLWPDKPEAGGAFNLARFVGIKKKLNYSMNIGPYGEGYGNFGPVGGVVFIFLYGLVIAFFLHKTLQMTKKYPSLIIWMPLLFYYVLNVETDILTTINSFVKAVVFIFFIYWGAKKFFRTDI